MIAMRRRLVLRCVAAAGAVLLAACSDGPKVETPRNPAWAVPVKAVHLRNFFRVNDNLYRGAQPAAKGMAELKALGIKSVINLRSLHSDKDEIGDLGLIEHRIKSGAGDPEDGEIVRFLQLAVDPANQPVFVHCAYGSDRTGLMIAMYRIAVEGWSNEAAHEEMVKGGYGFHTIYKDIQRHVRTVDAKALREHAGLPPR